MTVANIQQILSTPFQTQEALTFAVDYNAPSAVDPPSWARFVTQAQVTQFLSAKGATAFKHLQSVWDVLPEQINHTITINLAAGVHRPRAGMLYNRAFDLSGKTKLPGGSLVINGATASSWTAVVTSKSITAYQAASDNPYIDVTGTPYTGLNLKGYYVVLSTGQASLIHDHTDSRLFLTSSISPTPVGGTVIVARPSTILRNSLNDTGYAYYMGLRISFGDTNYPNVLISNLTIEPFGNPQWAAWFSQGFITGNYLLVDHQGVLDNFGVNPAGGSLAFTGLDGPPARSYSNFFSVRGRLQGTGSYDGAIMQVSQGASLAFSTSYFLGGNGGFDISDNGVLLLYTTVIDNVGLNADAQVSVSYKGRFSYLYGYVPGKHNEMRGGWASSGGIELLLGGVLDDVDFIAKEISGSTIILNDNVVWVRTHGYYPNQYIRDGGDNGNYGLEFKGLGSMAWINELTVFGAYIADVKFPDGTEFSIADIISGGGVIDGLGNVVKTFAVL